MNKMSKALIWFVISFIIFHAILYVMWGEKQVYWYLYTGIILIAGISYVFYQRDIESKRLLTSLGIGILVGVVLILIQLITSAMVADLKYSELIKELTRTGVYFKWQMLVTLVFVIPCHELYMRTVLQKELLKLNIPGWIGVIISSLCSASLFFYLDKMWIVFFVFLVQIVLSISYLYTRRIATSVVAQIVAVVILLLFHA
ncbi:CPBP family intramembrane metalloprotease [Staphylococcus gallinarum]|uniref:CPBP family glutamic-type intramembrane protease n=1 Tax=Staphylococcus gallinarum TaxID=1293 RepID=UPI000E6A610A|nr:CPBP family glutamic-type intramembrane protease [Staphylococcus gallinarum]RIP01535.1 CPBP family intramembrane metalloprotease [Staphylococcus gallinarum]